MDTVQLLDEIVVIDSDSTDETHSVATARAPSCTARGRSGPTSAPTAGKGEAMWKSLFVTRGDLIVFMDADLLDWDTHFVRGPARSAADAPTSPGQGLLRAAAA